MNFLSHLFLSGDSEGIIIGNFIADSVKGSEYLKYSQEIQKGILLHRKIDHYTDTHPIVELSKARLREKYKKYSSVIVDVYYDHYLATNWKNYSSEELSAYSQKIYSLVQQNTHLLPLKSEQFSSYMVRYNILEAYARLEGIERVLDGMSRRAKFESNMQYAIHDLRENYHLFEKEFSLFFPELQQFVNQEINIS